MIKILKSTTLMFILVLVVASIFGLDKGLIVLFLYLGLKELVLAKEYYENQQTKMAILSLIVGAFVFICGFLAITNII